MKTYLDSPDRVGHYLTDEDLALAHALQLNGRASFTEIAAVLGVSDQTALAAIPACAPPGNCACWA